MIEKDNITILYVEDEQGIRDSLKKPLQYFCNKLYIACDGEEGLELYKQYQPDIVVSDIRMPKMNGIEMARAIKLIDDRQHIVFTTAHSESDYFMDAIDMQADGFILKPIDFDKLEQKMEDIIEIINLKANYKKQQIQLIQSEKRASMGELIGNIAHQWRQPLSVISTMASGMQLKKELGSLDDDYFEQACEMIDEKAQYLSKTIDNFRNFIMEEKVQKEFDLKTLLESTLNIIEPDLHSHSISIVKNFENNIILNNYSNELKQALLNILNNAKEALVGNNIKSKYILISIYKKDENAIISIKDNAGGIQEDIIDKIYDPYFTTKHQSQGTGLGLHMTYDMITNSLKGKLQEQNVHYTYDNEEYKGAEFIITFPMN